MNPSLSREEVADIFLAAQEKRLTHLAKAIINQDSFLDDDSMQERCDYSGYTVLATAYQILLEMPETVVRAVIRGDLPELAQHADATSSNSASLALAQLLSDRIRGCGPQTTLEGSLVDMGFSKDGAERIIQHYTNINSNKVMQEYKDAAETIFGQFKYGLRGFIVCRIRKLNHCALSEILISRLAQSYTSRGGGFNGAIAGLSIRGGQLLSPTAWEEIGAVEPTKFYKQNLAVDREKTQSLRDLVARQRAVVQERLVQDIAIEMLPQAGREKLRAKEAELRDRLLAEKSGSESQVDQSQQESAADQEIEEPADDQPTGYTSDIDDSSEPIHSRPVHGNHNDDDDDDEIDSSIVYRY
ncbi:hypothetical protein V495_00155 [Pseudogymnoascus sp. VKM F-4514 (FW-929)]|nr:hypothetical protein V495_00155 [Pseudogymnoascus sp. VKM F-4514 (FW-929)]KFY67442.1 hypothetical protein V497_00383 [Pseudogymnoascus sp. VKM F-4516 (FW-969)]